MIRYLVTARHAYTMREFLSTWGSGLASHIEVLPYEALATREDLPLGIYVFSDLDRLTPGRAAIARRVATRLAAAPGVRILNRPSRVLGRLDLHRALHRAGINDYRADPASEPSEDYTYPVFLRRSGHLGRNIGPLLHTPDELRHALSYAASQGADLADLLIVEFCDTSDGAGVYRKYSAFVVGDRIVPRHLIFGRDWILKKPDLLDDDKLEEEARYLDGNPHEDWLREVCRLAEVEYGRVDYGVRGGKAQAWEINLNPQVMLLPEEYREEHLPAQRWFAREIEAALRALRQPVLEGLRVPLEVEADLLEELVREIEKEEDHPGEPASSAPRRSTM